MSHWLWSDGKNYHLTRNSWYSLSRIVTSNNDKWFYHRKDNNQSIYSLQSALRNQLLYRSMYYGKCNFQF